MRPIRYCGVFANGHPHIWNFTDVLGNDDHPVDFLVYVNWNAAKKFPPTPAHAHFFNSPSPSKTLFPENKNINLLKKGKMQTFGNFTAQEAFCTPQQYLYLL